MEPPSLDIISNIEHHNSIDQQLIYQTPLESKPSEHDCASMYTPVEFPTVQIHSPHAPTSGANTCVTRATRTPRVKIRAIELRFELYFVTKIFFDKLHLKFEGECQGMNLTLHRCVNMCFMLSYK